ncbi:MAG: hypothetical protein ACRD19_09435 [Terriglobia bacterium]
MPAALDFRIIEYSSCTARMAKRDQYYFGTLVKQIDVFAFPRTGSHFLAYCFSGLFDSVSLLPEIYRTAPEPISRQNEIKDEVLYGLDLREPGVPFQPVWLNPLAGGVHGLPVWTDNPILLLIRDPVATAFSAWRAGNSMGFSLKTAQDLNQHWDKYESFYDAGMKIIQAAPARSLFVRYEVLTANLEMLDTIVGFVGVKPKLSPPFVHWITRFENFVKEGTRRFYREGNNKAWEANEEWGQIVREAGPRDFRRFGYNSIGGQGDAMSQ